MFTISIIYISLSRRKTNGVCRRERPRRLRPRVRRKYVAHGPEGRVRHLEIEEPPDVGGHAVSSSEMLVQPPYSVVVGHLLLQELLLRLGTDYDGHELRGIDGRGCECNSEAGHGDRHDEPVTDAPLSRKRQGSERP